MYAIVMSNGNMYTIVMSCHHSDHSYASNMLMMTIQGVITIVTLALTFEMESLFIGYNIIQLILYFVMLYL